MTKGGGVFRFFAAGLSLFALLAASASSGLGILED